MIAHHQIIQEVALHFDVSEIEITSGRDAKLFARYYTAYMLVELTNSSHTEIAKTLGYKTISSVRVAYDHFKNELVGNKSLSKTVEKIKKSIEFKSRLINASNIDIYELAKSVAKQPQRKAISLSVNEIAALAMGYLEMRDVALAGEHLAHEIMPDIEFNIKYNVSQNPYQTQELYEISKTIIDTMAHMAGE